MGYTQNRSCGLGGLVTAVVAGSVIGTAAAQERFTIPQVVDFEDPRYEAFYAYAERGLNASVEDGSLIAEVESAPGSCRISTSTLGGDGTTATYADVTVDLAPDQEGSELLSGAGLMIRYSAEGGVTQFLGILMRNREYLVFSFQDGDVGQTLRGSVPGDTGWPVRLSAREIAGGAEFFVSGRGVGSLSQSGVTGTGLGLIHCGSGRFRFDNWGLNTRGDVGFEAAAGEVESADTVEIDSGPSVASDPVDSPELSAVPGPPPLPIAEWWVAEGGQPAGPITLSELRARVADGRITPDTLVWRDGMADWAPVSEALP